MKTTNLKWIAYALSALMLMQSCAVYHSKASLTGRYEVKEKKVRLYKIWVTQMDGTKQEGFLYSANEKGIVISGNYSSSDPYSTIEVESIETIKIRRKGNGGRTALILGGVGMLTGGVFGFIAGDDPPGILSMEKEDKAIAGALTAGILGVGIGALIGSIKEKMIVNGSKAQYNRYLQKLIEYSINSNTNIDIE